MVCRGCSVTAMSPDMQSSSSTSCCWGRRSDTGGEHPAAIPRGRRRPRWRRPPAADRLAASQAQREGGQSTTAALVRRRPALRPANPEASVRDDFGATAAELAHRTITAISSYVLAVAVYGNDAVGERVID